MKKLYIKLHNISQEAELQKMLHEQQHRFENELVSERQRLLEEAEARLRAQNMVEAAQLSAAITALHNSEGNQQKCQSRVEMMEKQVNIAMFDFCSNAYIYKTNS